MATIDYIRAAIAALIAMLGAVQALSAFLSPTQMGTATAIAGIAIVGLQVFEGQLPGGTPKP